MPDMDHDSENLQRPDAFLVEYPLEDLGAVDLGREPACGGGARAAGGRRGVVRPL